MSENRAVLITGCSEGGIGHAIAKNFQARGFTVYATARDVAKVGALAKLPNVITMEFDVADAGHIAAAVERVKDTTGSLKYLVNNAGRNYFMPILDTDIEQAKRIFDTNVWAPLAVTKAFAPLIIPAKGSIVNITSLSGHVNVPWMGAYAASKRSMEIMAETLRLELAPFGVGVLSIVTGAVQTNGQTYFGDFKLPDDSLYKPIEETIGSRASGNDGVKRMPVDEYANKVVNEICRGSTGRCWFGTTASVVKYGSMVAPQSVMEIGYTKGTGLDELQKEIQKKGGAKE